MSPTMKAIVIAERAENQPFIVMDVSVPSCGSDEVLIRNHYVGVNKGDSLRRKRALFPEDSNPPFILGFEGVGEIVHCGNEVSRFSVGDMVAYLVPRGAFAELVAVKATRVFLKPASLAPEVLAASCCIGLTAIGLLDTIDDPMSKTMLVHGATGSVGSTLLQIGNAKGMKMMGTVSTSSDLAAATKPSGGLYSLERGNFADDILAQTDGRGVDVIFDCLGQVVMSGNLKAIRPHGTICYYGSASGHATFPGVEILMRSLRIQGFVVFDCAGDPDQWNRMTEILCECLITKVITPHVQVIEPSKLTGIADAIEARQIRGRVVVNMQLL